ncbi:hypothetical protein K3G39_19800 [Pontibacter sp. HSC-14F20]|uniref:hypothetical protein n=1 Tax=Pontibacter sp. HSC-14F20 TaxID=2864136 RepID=UPI001C73D123|nr:hypothetical protein [Pontibacter sp. HSC-14F20]MBX0335485.1 hypothetical protein [Pontibacter sp. HSC-14F20]
MQQQRTGRGHSLRTSKQEGKQLVSREVFSSRLDDAIAQRLRSTPVALFCGWVDDSAPILHRVFDRGLNRGAEKLYVLSSDTTAEDFTANFVHRTASRAGAS